MNWIEGWDRQQQHLLPPQVEDYVAAENPVRFLDAFVDSLDLRKAGFVFPKEDRQGRGRPAYHPATLLKLFIYGYLHQIRSSRRLEAECGRNLEVMWLVGQLAPDFKTIADFRKDNADAFKAVVREFSALCRKMELFGGELLAIDGTKIKAQNSPAKNWTQSKLEKQSAKLEERLREYLSAVEQADSEGPQQRVAEPGELKRKIQKLQEQQRQTQARLQTLEQSGQSEMSATDAESRGMRCKGNHLVGYNVQGVVDAKHHLMVVSEVTQAASDQGQLATMAAAAKSELGIECAAVVADGGYFKSEDIKRCQEMGMEPHVPPGLNSPSERAGLYGKACFRYSPDKDVYVCPNSAELKLRRVTQDKGRQLFNYTNPSACALCGLKDKCTQTRFRTVTRWEHEEVIERMAAEMSAHPEKLAARKTLIEHPWGTLKWLLPGGFLVRGLRKVRAEVSLAHLAYNIKRVLATLGADELLAILRSSGLSLS
jgi:transposase